VLVIQRLNQTTRTVTPPITIDSVERFIVESAESFIIKSFKRFIVAFLSCGFPRRISYSHRLSARRSLFRDRDDNYGPVPRMLHGNRSEALSASEARCTAASGRGRDLSSLHGETVGTVWVVWHDAGRQFDSEDRRIVAELTRFAAAAYERLRSFKADDVRKLSRMHLVSEPRKRD
jgi:hypothetical protein